jgi:hypothetical protein
MALPKENRTAKVIAVEEAIKKMSPQELEALPGLDGEDFKVFGTLIQHFCFIDLNLRRALELFAISKMLPKSAANRYQDLPDSKLTEALIETAAGISWGTSRASVSITRTFTCSPAKAIRTRGRSWAAVSQLIACIRLLRGDPSS